MNKKQNKKRRAAVALSIAIPFAGVMLFDPREAIDNPHTHQESPLAPMLESEAAIISTFSGTQASISYRFDGYVTSID